MMRKTSWIVISLFIILLLAACGRDDNNSENRTAESTIVLTPVTSAAFNAGPELNVTVGGGLPGCNDPNDTECPAPLDLDMDGEASAEGITISYPARYFTASTENPSGVPVEISPNETYSFENQAVFQVFFAESVEQAMSELTDPLTAEWDTGTLTGTIGVVKDAGQDPQVNTIIGAFPLDDNRVVVLRLVVDGKYGWDYFSRTYERMLASLTVTPAE